MELKGSKREGNSAYAVPVKGLLSFPFPSSVTATKLLWFRLFSTIKINEYHLWVTLKNSVVNCDSQPVLCKELRYPWVE